MVILLGLAKDEILDRLPGRGKFNTAGNSLGSSSFTSIESP